MTPEDLAAEMSRSFRAAAQLWGGLAIAWGDQIARVTATLAAMLTPRP